MLAFLAATAIWSIICSANRKKRILIIESYLVAV